jgi:hypothetical protein
MKGNLLPSLLSLLLVSLAPGFAARAAREGAPAGQISAQTQTNASGGSNIEVENWAKPEPGWLYVLDPKPNDGGPGGRVWLEAIS